VNKTATLHWGQATMLCALAGLYRAMLSEKLELSFKGPGHEN
jgi:hypothetical protein